MKRVNESESSFWDIIENYNGFICSMSVNEIIWVLRRSGYDNFTESLRIMEKYNVSFSDSQIAAHAVLKRLKVATHDKDFEKISEIQIQIWNK